MSKHLTRLAKLEWRAQSQPAPFIHTIEIHRTYEDGPEVIETIYLDLPRRAQALASSQAAISKRTLHDKPQEPNPEN